MSRLHECKTGASVFRLGAQALVLLSVTFLLGACGASSSRKSSQLGFSKKVVNYGQRVPKGGGRYKVGKPYQIANKWYRPRTNTRYDRVGTASWYGDMFHGRKTANGEVYDMDALTAAHPTLPLPTLVEVTNLANNRSLIVRVNDRGPYKHNRIIDLSRKAAKLLKFHKKGTARVRVRYVGRAPLNGDDRYEKRVLSRKNWSYRRRVGNQSSSRGLRTVGSLSGNRYLEKDSNNSFSPFGRHD